jgi:hypothetical protein
MKAIPIPIKSLACRPVKKLGSWSFMALSYLIVMGKRQSKG